MKNPQNTVRTLFSIEHEKESGITSASLVELTELTWANAVGATGQGSGTTVSSEVQEKRFGFISRRVGLLLRLAA